MIDPSGFQVVADSECFTGGGLLARPVATMQENLRHYVATRGRVLVNQRYTDAATPAGGAVALASFVVDSTPLENILGVRCIWTGNFATVEGDTVTWYVSVSDTAGAGPVVSRTMADTFRGPIRGQAWRSETPYTRLRPFDHPLSRSLRYLEVQSDWVSVPIDSTAGLATQGRTVTIYGSAGAQVAWGQDPAMVLPVLRSVCVVGFRGAD